MSPNASPAATTAVAPAVALPTSARREARHAALLIGTALAMGSVLQAFVEPGPRAAAAVSTAGAAVVFLASRLARGRWRDSLTGFRFVAMLLFALAAAAVLGTLIVQGKPADYYPARYGALGSLALALRLDDVFHSLWFAGLVALFAATIAASAAQRLPPHPRHLGFLVCHAGLLTALAGAAVSSAFSVRGRVDLHAGADGATAVRVTRGGTPTGETVPLGFELRLDRFDLVKHAPEFRVGYYEQGESDYRLQATFAPEVDVRRVLPRGESFRVRRVVDDASRSGGELRNPAAVLEIAAGGEVHETPPLFALHPGSNYARVKGGVLVFERRAEDVKDFVSHLTLTDGDEVRQARVAVNEPFEFLGWTLYQANYEPRDPTYSGVDAVRDPGVRFVFLGFLLIGVGVTWMVYVDGRAPRRPAVARSAARGEARR